MKRAKGKKIGVSSKVGRKEKKPSQSRVHRASLLSPAPLVAAQHPPPLTPAQARPSPSHTCNLNLFKVVH